MPGIIQFLGFVHREELPEIYALAEGLIFPTHSDPWGLVVNEAMACGLPVIVTSVAGCTLDLVQDGWNGFVVPPRDASALARATASLAETPNCEWKWETEAANALRLTRPPPGLREY